MDLASLPACAEATQAGFIRRALDAASAAVIAVRRGVNTDAVAGDERKDARIAAPARFAALPPGRASAYPTTTIAAAPSLRARPLATTDTGPLVTVWRRSAADVATRSAIVWVATQVSTCPSAIDRAIDAPVEALPVNARAVLVLTRVSTRSAAGSAVVEVVGEIGADVAARARSTETAGVAVARPTRREAGILSALAGTPAKGFARIAPPGPGGSQAQRV
jgi:hypothetical protein